MLYYTLQYYTILYTVLYHPRGATTPKVRTKLDSDGNSGDAITKHKSEGRSPRDMVIHVCVYIHILLWISSSASKYCCFAHKVTGVCFYFVF